MSKTIKITCHGCNRKVDAYILKRYYFPNKPIKHVDWSDPIYSIFGKLKISDHKRGWFKPRYNKSGKIFRQKIGVTPSCQ